MAFLPDNVVIQKKRDITTRNFKNAAIAFRERRALVAETEVQAPEGAK
jgi:hypothetical protein